MRTNRLDLSKYYDLARKLMKVIPLTNPSTVFEVDSSDLSIRMLAELKSMNKSLSK
jgi:hypothetical protein